MDNATRPGLLTRLFPRVFAKTKIPVGSASGDFQFEPVQLFAHQAAGFHAVGVAQAQQVHAGGRARQVEDVGVGAGHRSSWVDHASRGVDSQPGRRRERASGSSSRQNGRWCSGVAARAVQGNGVVECRRGSGRDGYLRRGRGRSRPGSLWPAGPSQLGCAGHR